jgi:hypothetical protein
VTPINNAVRLITPLSEAAFQNVTVTQDVDGHWHIRGRVQNVPTIGTIVKIVNGPGTGQSTVDEEGNFDINVQSDPNAPGGSFSIVGVDGNGNQFGGWDGLIY